MGKSLQARPSEIYNIDDELTAWCFDRAIQTFGGALESRLQEVAEKAKNRKAAKVKVNQELDRWLSSADTKAATGRFRDPMAGRQA